MFNVHSHPSQQGVDRAFPLFPPVGVLGNSLKTAFDGFPGPMIKLSTHKHTYAHTHSHIIILTITLTHRHT